MKSKITKSIIKRHEIVYHVEFKDDNDTLIETDTFSFPVTYKKGKTVYDRQIKKKLRKMMREKTPDINVKKETFLDDLVGIEFTLAELDNQLG